MALLKSLDHKVDALIQGPFGAGCSKLKDAMAEHRSANDRKDLLKSARDSFYLSINQDPEPLNRSLAALNLAQIWRELGSPHDVRERLEEAHGYSVLAVLTERKRGPAGFAGWREKTMSYFTEASRDKRFANAVDTLGPYVNALAYASWAWGSSSSRTPTIPNVKFDWQDLASWDDFGEYRFKLDPGTPPSLFYPVFITRPYASFLGSLGELNYNLRNSSTR